MTRPTAAEPTRIFIALVPLADTPPEIAVMVAVPEPFPATYLTVTRPETSVSAWDGWTAPKLVVKLTSVPLCGGLPPDSITWAMMSAVPLAGRAVAEATSVIVDPLGARSGTLSHASVRNALTQTTSIPATRRGGDIMESLSILIPMHLAGQARRELNGAAGYAMAALLVALSIMAIMFTVAMPVWKQTAQREKEEELVFRGRQYVHAIGLFQRKFANAYPPNIDVLVVQRFLRKKFKDPITNADFVPIPVGQGAPGTQTPAGQRGAPGTSGQTPNAAQIGRAGGPGTSGGLGTGGGPGTGGPAGQTAGGISGVTSKSKAQSIRLYNGRGHYNEWAFVYIQQQQPAGGGGAPGSTTPGGRGGRGAGGTQPGSRPGPGTFGPGGPGGPGGTGRPGGPGGPGRPTGRFPPFGGGPVPPSQPPRPGGRF